MESVRQLTDTSISFVNPATFPAIDTDTQARREQIEMMSAAREGVLVFWLAGQEQTLPTRGKFPKPYGQTSRLELGYYLGLLAQPEPTLALIIGVDKSIPSYSYTLAKIRTLSPQLRIHESIDSVANAIVSHATNGARATQTGR